MPRTAYRFPSHCPSWPAPGHFQLAPIAALHVRAEKRLKMAKKEKFNFPGAWKWVHFS